MDAYFPDTYCTALFCRKERNIIYLPAQPTVAWYYCTCVHAIEKKETVLKIPENGK